MRSVGHSASYGASIATGPVLRQFARWLRDVPVEPDLSLNLLASELTVAEAPAVRLQPT